MSRANIALIIVLIAQIALVAVVLGDDDDTDNTLARGGALLSGFNADTVTDILIEDDAGLALTLSRTDEGTWVLPAADNFPAQDLTVQQRLDLIERFDAERLVTRTDDNLRRFDVAEDDFYRRLVFTDADNNTYTLYVGATGSGANRYTRVEGSSEVYLNADPGQTALTTDPTTWIDTVYFSTLPENLVSLTVENASGSVQLTQTDGVWSLPDIAPNQRVDRSAIDRLTSRFTTYRLDDPVGQQELPEYELDTPLVTVTLEVEVPDPDAAPAELVPPDDNSDDLGPGTATADTATDDTATADAATADAATADAAPEVPTIIETRTLRIGAATGNASHYTKLASEPYVVTTPENFVNELATLTRDDLLTAQPYSVFGG